MSYEDELFQCVDLLGSDVTDGEVRVQIGDLASGKGFGASAPVYGVEGFLTCPNDPDENGAATGLAISDGNTKRVVATRDNRFAKLAGNLNPGDRAIVTKGAARFRINTEKQSVSLATSDDGTTDGRSIYLTVSRDNGLDFASPWGRFMIGPMGIHLVHASGARLDLSALSGLPGPLSTVASTAKLEAGVVSVSGGAVALGSDGGAASQTAIDELWAFLGQLVAGIATITATTPGAAAMASITPELAQLKIAMGGIGKVV